MKLYKSKKKEQQIISTYDQLLKQWGVRLAESEVPTRYGMTHVITWGDPTKEPLVLFHGVGDDSALMWIYNAKELSKHFRLYAIDTIGGPGKTRPNEKYGPKFQDEEWIDDILDQLKLDQVFVAGVSNGGYLSQYYGLKRSERVRKLISMSGCVPAGSSGSPMKTMMKIFFPEALFPTKKNIKRLLCKLAGENVSVFLDHPLIVEHYAALIKGFNNMAMRYHNVRTFSVEEIDKIRDKTLYLIGEDDPFALLGGKKMLLEYRMNAKFYKKTGHGINHERASEINADLINYFLGGIQDEYKAKDCKSST